MNRAVLEHRWRAMGAHAHVVLVDAHPSLLDHAVARVEALEARWSRFRPTSEVSAINRAAPHPVVVSPETVDIVQRALAAQESTSGWFDPGMLVELEAIGYDQSFETLDRVATMTPLPLGKIRSESSTSRSIRVDPFVGSVAVADGCGLDLGGIGKGRAADLVAAELAFGAAGVLVNLGGDLRAVGRGPTSAGWVIAIDTVYDEPQTRLALGDGAVATSSQLTRRWRHADVVRHHLIDPLTLSPARSDVAAATVVAGEAERAEVLAKAALVAGAASGAALLADHDVAAQLVLVDGSVERYGGFERFVVRESPAHPVSAAA